MSQRTRYHQGVPIDYLGPDADRAARWRCTIRGQTFTGPLGECRSFVTDMIGRGNHAEGDPTLRTGGDAFPMHVEQYVCPGCEASIRQDLVFTTMHKPEKDRVTPVARTARVNCDACNRWWQAEQLLEGGVWRTVGNVELVTHPNLLAALNARKDEKLGVLQRLAS